MPKLNAKFIVKICYGTYNNKPWQSIWAFSLFIMYIFYTTTSSFPSLPNTQRDAIFTGMRPVW